MFSKLIKRFLASKVYKVLKFEVQLLVMVLILGAVVYFGINALIYKSAAKIAEAYTQGF